jgi:hypothetical protein
MRALRQATRRVLQGMRAWSVARHESAARHDIVQGRPEGGSEKQSG